MSVYIENKLQNSLADSRALPKALPKIPDIPKTVAFWMERSRQRRALANLDRRLLDDIGITAEEAQREFKKPFWK